jgi:cytidylate kinase
MVAKQKVLAESNSIVMEGRDIGTVVLPEARLKAFLTASPETRARRRHEEIVARGLQVALEEIREQQQRRDRQDTSRVDSPLQVAQGAVVVDTTGMSVSEVVDRLLEELDRTTDGRLTGAAGTP